MLKDSAISEIVSAIRAAASGQRHVTPLLTGYLLNRRRALGQAEDQTGLRPLTDAERGVLKLVADYKTSKEIAETLFVSVRTVEHHRSNTCAKLGLTGKNALLAFALTHKSEL